MSSLLVVMGSILGVFGVVQRQSAYVKDRSETLDTMRIAVDRMTKEIRQARVVEPDGTAPASRFEMTTFLLGVEADIVYAVAGGSLTRSVNGGTADVIQNDLASTEPVHLHGGHLRCRAGGLLLACTVHPPRRPDTTLVLNSEVRLRNKAVTA